MVDNHCILYSAVLTPDISSTKLLAVHSSSSCPCLLFQWTLNYMNLLITLHFPRKSHGGSKWLLERNIIKPKNINFGVPVLRFWRFKYCIWQGLGQTLAGRILKVSKQSNGIHDWTPTVELWNRRFPRVSVSSRERILQENWNCWSVPNLCSVPLISFVLILPTDAWINTVCLEKWHKFGENLINKWSE